MSALEIDCGDSNATSSQAKGSEDDISQISIDAVPEWVPRT